VGQCDGFHGAAVSFFVVVGMPLLELGAGIRGSASMFRVPGGRLGMFDRWLVGLRVWRLVVAAIMEEFLETLSIILFEFVEGQCDRSPVDVVAVFGFPCVLAAHVFSIVLSRGCVA